MRRVRDGVGGGCWAVIKIDGSYVANKQKKKIVFKLIIKKSLTLIKSKKNLPCQQCINGLTKFLTTISNNYLN